jgi:hypothetical protein
MQEEDNEANLFFVDGSTDRIGIGTSSPGTALHMRIDGGDANLLLERSTAGVTSKWGIKPYNDKLHFRDESASPIIDNFTMTSDGYFGIGTASPSAQLHITGSDTSDQVIFENTDDGAGSAPDLVFYRNSASPAINDILGRIDFRGKNDGGTSIDYGTIYTILDDETAGTEDGSLWFQIERSGGTVVPLKLKSTEIIVNDNGVDTDFRVESVNNTNMLHVNAGNNFVGIGGIPTERLTVIGPNNSSASELKVKDTDGRGILIESPYSGFAVGYVGTDGTNSALGFKVNGTEYGRFGTNGFFGIGTSSPTQAKLDVSHSAAEVGSFIRSNNSGSGQIRLGNSDGHVRVGGQNGSFEVYNSSNTSARLYIDNVGNVGLGNNTSPSSLLHLSSSDPQITITDTDGTGSQVIKAVTDNLEIVSSNHIKFDADSGLFAFKDSGTDVFSITNTGNIIFKTVVSDSDLLIRGNDGGSEITALTLDMSEAGDATFNSNIYLGDNKKVNFGAGNDLQIYHTGGSSYISDEGTGHLNLRTNGSDIRMIKPDGTIMLQAVPDNRVDLYYNGSKKFETTSTGIDVTGTAVTDGLTVAGNVSVDGGTIKLDGNYPTGTNNVALGNAALDDGSLTGNSNTAIGNNSLSATTGAAQQNTGVGHGTLQLNTTGISNTAVGSLALSSSVTASNNTAVGYSALRDNTSGNNTAVGYFAMEANISGSQNTALGMNALLTNSTGSDNVAVGYDSLKTNSTGTKNTAIGREALEKYTVDGATAVGYQALEENTTGVSNTAVGYLSFSSMTTGARNVGIGYAVGQNSNTSNSTYVGYRTGLNASGVQNTFIGYESGTQAGGQLNTYVGTSAGGSGSGDNNVAVGRSAGTVISGDDNVLVGESSGGIVSGNNNIIIGANSAPSASNANNEITLGDANITSLRIPGLASGASSGDVLTYDGTDITLSAPTGVSAGFAVAMAIAL